MRAFVVTVPAIEAELAADTLFASGVAAVEERPARGDTVELWTHVGDDDRDLAAAAVALAGRWPWRDVGIDEAGAESWRAHATPVWVDEALVVYPAWLPPPVVGDGVLAVPIDPGGAFGLGDHPTTRLTLRAARAIVAGHEAPRRVLDVGCGSGVLAIVAAHWGSEEVVAIDVHPPAIEATVANAARNRVSARVEASATRLADVSGGFDLVLANVLAPTLVELAADLVRVTGAHGRLVASGVLEGRYGHVAAALSPLHVVREWTADGWAAVELAAR